MTPCGRCGSFATPSMCAPPKTARTNARSSSPGCAPCCTRWRPKSGHWIANAGSSHLPPSSATTPCASAWSSNGPKPSPSNNHRTPPPTSAQRAMHWPQATMRAAQSFSCSRATPATAPHRPSISSMRPCAPCARAMILPAPWPWPSASWARWQTTATPCCWSSRSHAPQGVPMWQTAMHAACCVFPCCGPGLATSDRTHHPRQHGTTMVPVSCARRCSRWRGPRRVHRPPRPRHCPSMTRCFRWAMRCSSKTASPRTHGPWPTPPCSSNPPASSGASAWRGCPNGPNAPCRRWSNGWSSHGKPRGTTPGRPCCDWPQGCSMMRH